MMKRASFTLAVITICVQAFAQQPLQDAVNSIKATKGYISRGVSSENLRDSRDSLCTISITDFQIQGKGNSARMEKVTHKMISQILACYEVEAVNSTSSHSYVIPSDSTSLPGFKNVKLYYAEGKEPYKSESGHSYVSVRNDFGADGYRLATCIEWWKNAEKEFLGRIVEVRGPFSKETYADKSSEKPAESHSWIYDVNIQIYESQELVSMWRETKDPDRKQALEESIAERYESMCMAMSGRDKDSCDFYVAKMLKQISRVPSYKARVFTTTGEEWNLSIKELANAYSSMDVINLSLAKQSRLFTARIKLNRLDETAPELKAPTIKKASNNYNAKDYRSFAVYHDFPTACKDHYKMRGIIGEYAIWCTKDSTYLARYTPMGKKNYMECNSKDYIRDSRTGEIYHELYTRGFKPDEIFWVEDHDGDYIITVSVYPALPITCTMIDIEEGPTPDFIPGTTGWEERRSLKKIPVSALQENQTRMILHSLKPYPGDEDTVYMVDGHQVNSDEFGEYSSGWTEEKHDLIIHMKGLGRTLWASKEKSETKVVEIKEQ